MAGELTRWIATPAIDRQRNREIAVVRKDTDVALCKIAGITEVAEWSMIGSGKLSMTKRQLEGSAPEDAAKLDHLQSIAVMAMGNVMERLSNRW
jgi:hypothetical protein